MKATLENVTDVQPENAADYNWFMKVGLDLQIR